MIPTTATNALTPTVRAEYQVQPNNSAPAHRGMIMTVTTAKPDPRSDITLSNEGSRTAPTTARAARMIRITGLRYFFLFSQRSCSTSSGSVYADWVGGQGSEAAEIDSTGELGRVVYRGVGTEFGM